MKIGFPKRSKQHVSETVSLKLFKSLIPDDWVIRELGERDYGVDLSVEIVRGGIMTGDVIVGQLKGVQHDPLRGKSIFKSIKETTTNYLLQQPAPAFLFVASSEAQQVYWRSLRDHHRNLREHEKLNHVKLVADFKLTTVGIKTLDLAQQTERVWDRVERAIISAIMFFTSLGPLVLGCKRFPATEPIPSAVQQLLISHFTYNELIQRYFLKDGKRYPSLPVLYDRAMKAGHISKHFKFTGQGARDFLEVFLRDYLEAIEQCDLIVRGPQKRYWREIYPYQIAHIEAFPRYFIDDDWYPRYYFDEFENETQHIRLDFFTDIDEGTRKPFVKIFNEHYT